MTVAIKPGSTWERLTGGGDRWILRDNETGEQLCVLVALANDPAKTGYWGWSLLLHPKAIGQTVGHRPVAMGDVETALEKRGCLVRPIYYT